MDIHTPCLEPSCPTCNAALPQKFAHLHQHTQYSLLDGAAQIKDLLKWVKSMTSDHPACAITDHGNMHGAVTFYNYATELEVKPILGFEAYVASGSRRDRKRGEDNERGIFHLTMLAKNFEGYQNLCRLSSLAYLEGYYYKPRIDHELIERYHKGIIVLSGCLGAEVPQLIMNDRLEEARQRLEWYLGIFKENYYLEIQNHGLPEQQKVNAVLKQWGQELGIGMVATNDGHYVQKSDARAHETLLAIQTKATLADENRFKFPCDEFYVKTLEEMQAALPPLEWGSEMFSNTADIARVCTVDLPVGKKRVYQMPLLPIPAGRTTNEELRIQSYQGTLKRYPQHTTPEFWRSYALASSAYLDNLEPLKNYYWTKYQTKMQEDPASYSPLHFEKIDFGGQVGELKLRIASFDPQTDDLERVFTLVALIGSLWEELGKAVGAKYTLYPPLELLEAGEHEETHPHALVILRRTEYELSVINTMGFPDYFLIVSDYINWAKDHGIAVGPGRGSGAGSIVAYLMRITNLDPLEFGLLFERFLNPERVSMPDFDIDFSDSRRDEVIQYVRIKYGDEKVAQIATFGSLASRSVFKDVARVMGLPHQDVDAVNKMIPVKFGKPLSLEQAKETVSDIDRLIEANPALKVAFTQALELEGLTRHSSTHPSGVVISRGPLSDLVPLMRDNQNPTGMSICQYDMKAVEDIGLIKMDFLGLRTLSFLEEAKRILKESQNLEIDFDALPFDDEKTFNLLSSGQNKGIFQLERSGVAETARKLQPRRLADIIALSALYRPGPMENIPTYIRRHHGLESVDYVRDGFPNSAQWLEKILEETYGIPVYQEQIMQIASEVAGYSLGEADLLRRAMGKKSADEMKKQRQRFNEGALLKGVDLEESHRIFDLLERFANYGFNKCLVGETRVYASDGRGYTLLELYQSQEKITVPSLSPAQTWVEQKVVGIYQNGIKAVFKLTSSSGKTLTATGNHRILSRTGWKNLEDFKVGDELVAPSRLPVEGHAHWEKAELERLARRIVQQPYAASASRSYANSSGGWGADLDWLETTDGGPLIPPEVFTLQNTDLALLLGHVWAQVGGAEENHLWFEAVNLEWSRQIQHLLLRLGITSRIETQLHHRLLHITDPASLRAFEQWIAPQVKEKPQLLEQLSSWITELPQTVQGDILWERVVSLEPMGEQMTFDLEVENTHNFLAGDLVVHNSHSAAYSIISYQTAWLKANHPVEFLAALLTTEHGDSKKVAEYIADSRRLDIEVLPPDINRSSADFVVFRGTIFFGLAAIKNLSEEAVHKILEQRSERPFSSLFDFCSRLQKRVVNSRALETLIKAGAFDAFGERAQLLASVDQAMNYGVEKNQIRGNGMDSLFGMVEIVPEPTLRSGITPLAVLEKWRQEKEAIGLYISGHPLEQHPLLTATATCQNNQVQEWFDSQGIPSKGRVKVFLAGMLCHIQKKPTKAGEMMATFQLADQSQTLEVVCYSKTYQRIEKSLEEEIPVLLIAELDLQEDSLRVIAHDLLTAEELTAYPQIATLHFSLEESDLGRYRVLEQALSKMTGNLKLCIQLEHQGEIEVWEPEKLRLDLSNISNLEREFPWLRVILSFDPSSLLERSNPSPPWIKRIAS